MYSAPELPTISELMADFLRGDKLAVNRLVELLYPELRKLAAAKMKGERTAHTWQPTLLVNELYLTLFRSQASSHYNGDGQEKSAFLGLAGLIMKRLLIDHARPLHRRVEKVELGDAPVPQDAEGLRFVEEALSRLGSLDLNLRRVVEMRVFEGLTGNEIAEELNCSPRTVANYWTFAKRWLQKELA